MPHNISHQLPVRRHWLIAEKRPFLKWQKGLSGAPVIALRSVCHQLATDLLKMSVMILSVVERTAVGSLLMVAMLRLAW